MPTSQLEDGISDRSIDNPVLEISDIYAGYGNTTVLQGLSATVERGEVVSLIGRNGVGKTTTLRAILGDIIPKQGRVLVEGNDITELPPDESIRQGLGYVPEDRRVFPELTVEENLEIAKIGRSGADFQLDPDAIYDRFESLDRRRDALGRELSGGEQQMLAIGRALIRGATVLMLDEPTEGLAPLIVERFSEIIQEYNEEGLTVLLVEQRIPVALSLADHVYVLDKGSIAFSGTPDELEAAPDVLDQYLGVTE